MPIEDRESFLVWVEVEKEPKFEEVRHERMPWAGCPIYSVELVEPGLFSLDPTLCWENYCDKMGYDGPMQAEFTFEPEIVDGKVHFKVRKRGAV